MEVRSSSVGALSTSIAGSGSGSGSGDGDGNARALPLRRLCVGVSSSPGTDAKKTDGGIAATDGTRAAAYLSGLRCRLTGAGAGAANGSADGARGG